MTTDELIRGLAKLGDVAPPLEGLPGLLGVGPDELSQAAAAAIEAGLARVWEKAPPALVLTPLAAGRLGIAIDAAGERWVGLGDPARHREARGDLTIQGRPGDAPFWPAIADDKAREPGEEAPMASWEALDRVPMPRVLLGLRVAWPVEPGPRGACGICKGLPLAPGEYCLGCDRMAREPAASPPPPVSISPTSPTSPPPGPLARIAPIAGGGIGPRQQEPDETALPRLPPRAPFWRRPARDAPRAGKKKGGRSR